MSLSKFYQGKVVLITGASMGIGKELAKQVLAHGGKVAITARNESRLNAVIEEFNTYTENILVHAGDATDYSSNQKLVEKIIARFGKLDILINNAGMSCYGEVETLQPSVAEQVININIYGSLYPAMSAIPELKKSKGSILFVSSIAGFHGIPGYSTYSLSKMALTGLSQSMRTELKSSNIYVGISYVGFTENEEDKKTLSPNGQLEKVPPRPKRLTATRETTARLLLHQIMHRKHSASHSFLGSFTNVLSRYAPALLSYFLSRNYHKQQSAR
ncbi:MAG: SDR family oxidoreductase [Cyclobacteriaceae bacterium]|nr:SDR family oxidoreductase [Cyclobacteriaceae bacterium]